MWRCAVAVRWREPPGRVLLLGWPRVQQACMVHRVACRITWHGRRCLRHLGVAAMQHASQHTGVSMRASGVGCRVEPGARQQEQRLRRQRHPRSRQQHGRGRSSSCSHNSSRGAGGHGLLAAPPPVGGWLRHRSRPPHERCRPRHARTRAHALHPACSLVRRAPPQVNDISLEDYIAVKPKYARFTNHSAGRFQKRRFRKAQCPIVERCARARGPLGGIGARGPPRAGAVQTLAAAVSAARRRGCSSGRDGSQPDGSQPAGGAARYDAPLPRAAHVSALLAARPAAA